MAEDFKKLIKNGKLWIGTKETLKYLKLGMVARVFLSSNCPQDVKESITRYAEMGGVAVEGLSMTNEELGPLCKKPFSISVLARKKEQK